MLTTAQTGTLLHQLGHALVIVLMLSVLVPAGRASSQPADNLHAMGVRVRSLVTEISRTESRLIALRNRANDLSRRISSATADIDAIDARIEEAERREADADARLDSLRRGIGERARSLYKRGSISLLDLVLGARTLREFVDRFSFAAAIVRRDAGLVDQATRVQAHLEDQQAEQRRLLRSQQSTASALASRHGAIQSTLVAEIATASRLARERREAAQLARELEARIAAAPPARTVRETAAPPAGAVGTAVPAATPSQQATKEELAKDVARLKYVAGRGMTIGYGQWAADFLRALGAPISQSNLVAVVAWEAAEGTLATWNPLATTYAMPGATIYNSHGVRNYVSKEQGIEATLRTLALPGHRYEAITASLKASAPAMQTARAINASDWCRGCAGGTYVVGLVPFVEKSYSSYAG